MVEVQRTSPYIVSALRHRPSTFGDVLGQEHVTTTLRHSLERDRIANGYVFAGPRGTGKTSTARILAKALNCFNRQGAEPCNACDSCVSITNGTSLDVLEIDAASNRGINEMRDLRENVRFTPTHGRYRVVIIDEVHMLTPEANNALLKTLEEPPSHVKFIMATTEMHKMPTTILSRCQRFRFRRIPVNILMDKLRAVADEEPTVDLGPPAERDRILYHIARLSEGALRDALVSLDQLLSFCSGQVSLAEAEDILGVVEFESLDTLIRSVLMGDLQEILLVIERLSTRGKEPAQFLKEILGYLRHLLVSKVAPDRLELVELPEESRQALVAQGETTTIEGILQIIDVFSDAERRMRFAAEGRMILEVAAIKAAKIGESVTLPEILKQLSSLAGSNPSSTSRPVHQQQRVPTKPARSSQPAPIASKNEPSGCECTARRAPAVETPEKQPKSNDRLADAWNRLAADPDLMAPTINSALDQSRPISLADGLLTVGVPSKAGLSRLQDPHYQETIKAKLEDSLGSPVRVTYELSENSEQTQAQTVQTQPFQPGASELLAQVREHAVIRSLMEHIPGTVVGVQPEPRQAKDSQTTGKEETAE
ncbi:MAG: DNA polymerase III subunit gamma/tau [bacterium]